MPSAALPLSLSPSPPFSHVAYIIPHRCSRGRYLYLLACGSRGSEIEFSVSIHDPPLPPSCPLILVPPRLSLSLSHVPPRQGRSRLAEDLRRRPSPEYHLHPTFVSFYSRRANILFEINRYADTMISEFLLERAPIAPSTKYCAYNDKLARNEATASEVPREERREQVRIWIPYVLSTETSI